MASDSSPNKKEIKISIPFNRDLFKKSSFDQNKEIELERIAYYYYDDVNKVAYI
jgi:hypothetical protein